MPLLELELELELEGGAPLFSDPVMKRGDSEPGGRTEFRERRMPLDFFLLGKVPGGRSNWIESGLFLVRAAAAGVVSAK